MANHLDWVPTAITGVIAAGASWAVVFTSRTRLAKERRDAHIAAASHNFTDALSIGGEWRQLYDQVCEEMQVVEAENVQLRVENKALKAEME